jgi:hypothetical protein
MAGAGGAGAGDAILVDAGNLEATLRGHLTDIKGRNWRAVSPKSQISTIFRTSSGLRTTWRGIQFGFWLCD